LAHTEVSTTELYDTPSMFRVVRKTLQLPSSFPITSWEFVGPTALVEIEGFVAVVDPGVYGFAVRSRDRFLVWLQEKWLSMVAVGAEGLRVGLQPGDSVTSIEFKAAGELVVQGFESQVSGLVRCWLYSDLLDDRHGMASYVVEQSLDDLVLDVQYGCGPA